MNPIPCLTPLMTVAVVVACGGDQSDATRAPLRIAVAGNFAVVHERLSRMFQAATGAAIETSLGATGSLYAQIVNGAPYDVFLAADDDRPARLEREGLTVAGSRFTYAEGRIALYAPSWETVPGENDPRLQTIQHLAIANPNTAPYGAAAMEVLRQWGLWENLEDRIVRGENVGQAFHFVESGAAEAGIVALSQVFGRNPRSYWVVPERSHEPIRQDGVVLLAGRNTPDARAFIEFMQGEEARAVLLDFGYRTP